MYAPFVTLYIPMAQSAMNQWPNSLACLHTWLCTTLVNGLGLQALAEAVSKNKVIKTLGLGGLKFGTDETALEAIMRIITDSTTITALSLGNNGLGDEGIEMLEEAISANTVIEELDLGGNEISGTCAVVCTCATQCHTMPYHAR